MDVFGSSGVRGVVNEGFTPTFVHRIALAAGSTLDAPAVALARDTRHTGRMFADAASAGLAATGTAVHRLGIVPTPGVQAYAETHGVPAVVITASHNPPAYNGVKLVGADGVELSHEELERIEGRLLSEKFDRVAWDAIGESRAVDSARRAYVEDLLGAIDGEAIAAAGLTVALDPGHGAGALTSPGFLRRLGAEVVTVNAQPDGHFPGRDPEPVPANLDDLARLVRTAGADVGIAHDGDADRAIFVDETGAHVSGDAVLAALAAAELSAGDAAVSAVNVSQRLVDVADAAGATLELTPIGSTNLTSRIRKLRAKGASVPIAGEGNGGIIFPSYRLARDGAYTAARFLELVADEPVSSIVEPYDGYENVRVNVGYGDAAEREAMLAAADRYARNADAELTTIDGYRLDYGDAWVLARASGTEPVVRLVAEAREDDRAAALIEELHTRLRAARANARE